MKRIFHLWVMLSILTFIFTVIFEQPIIHFIVPIYWMGFMVLMIWINRDRIFNDNNLD